MRLFQLDPVLLAGMIPVPDRDLECQVSNRALGFSRSLHGWDDLRHRWLGSYRLRLPGLRALW